MTNYENLALIPWLVAETVASKPYTGEEISWKNREGVALTEGKRGKMTPEQVKEFGDLFDSLCRAAYKIKADWFLDCVNSKSNDGRDQLYTYAAHNLAAYLFNPERYKQKMLAAGSQ